MALVQADGQHQRQDLVGVGAFAVAYQQDVGVLFQPGGHRVGQHQRAPVVVAHLGHEPGLVQQRVAAAVQRDARHRQGGVVGQRLPQIAQGALVVAVEQVLVVGQRHRRLALHGQRPVKVRHRDHGHRDVRQVLIHPPQRQLLPRQQLAVGQVGVVHGDLRHRPGVLRQVHALVAQVGGNVGVAVLVHVGQHVQVIGDGGLRGAVHGKGGACAQPHRHNGDGQYAAHRRHHNEIGAQAAVQLAYHKGGQAFQVAAAVGLRQPHPHRRRRVKQQHGAHGQRAGPQLHPGFAPHGQDAVAVKDRRRGADQRQRGRKQQHGRRPGGRQRFVFAAGGQQVDQLYAGHGKDVEHPHQHKNDRKAQHRQPQRRGRQHKAKARHLHRKQPHRDKRKPLRQHHPRQQPAAQSQQAHQQRFAGKQAGDAPLAHAGQQVDAQLLFAAL